MKQVLYWALAVLLPGGFYSCAGQPEEKQIPIGDYIRKNGEKLLADNKLSGLFVAVVDNGKRSYYNFGFADTDRKVKFDSATVFEIGSITKTFTAYMLTALLMEKNIPDTASIFPYLPDSVQQNRALAGTSFLSLMNHTSGLERIPANMNLNSMQPYDNYTAADLFSYLRNAVPRPNGKSNYSNLGAGLAGHLAERISGKKYTELLDQYIFIPFGIGTANKNLDSISNKSHGFFEQQKAPYWNMNVLAPAGDLDMSAKDLLSYLEKTAVPQDSLRKEVIDKILEPTAAVNADLQVGKGWHISNNKEGQSIYWHNGGTYGFSSFVAFIRGRHQAVVVVANRFDANQVTDGFGMRIVLNYFRQDYWYGH